MICQNCLQIECGCQSGIISIKRLGLAIGCVVYENGVRCREMTEVDSDMCYCHITEGLEKDSENLRKLFGKS